MKTQNRENRFGTGCESPFSGEYCQNNNAVLCGDETCIHNQPISVSITKGFL